MKRMMIGYNRKSYPEIRNIINKIDTANYVKVYNFKLIIINVLRKYFGRLMKSNQFLHKDRRYFFNDFNLNKAEVIHLFNYLSHGNTPWVVTFESILPRTSASHKLARHSENEELGLIKDKTVIEALRLMAGAPCIKIIALSKCNLRMQKKFLDRFPEYYEKIAPKLINMHPPQELLVNSWDEKSLTLEGDIKFMFVGGNFFRKGGREILEVFQELRENYKYPVKLSIVSSLTTDTYASNTSKSDVKSTELIIERNKEWIDYYYYLPNPEVLQLMRASHIGLLPTYADSYGYSVLEFQAAGCPVISTNVRALPEINNNKIGWMIQVQKHPSGEGLYATRQEREDLSKRIKVGLKKR